MKYMILSLAVAHLPLTAAEASEAHTAEVLRLVRQSPEFVAQHEQAAWLELFSENASLQDPVGSPVLYHTKTPGDPFASFYEAFIAPNAIEFRPALDFVDGYEVLRDVTIHTEMSDDCVIDVDAFVYYRVKEEAAGLRIQEMKAYWELGQNLKAIASHGLKCVAPSIALSGRIFKHLGADFALQYSGAALKGIRGKGKASLFKLQNALRTQNEKEFMALFTSDARIRCSSDGEERTSVAFWKFALESDMRWEFDQKMLSAGRETLGRATIQNDYSFRTNVVRAGFADKSDLISHLKCFES